jgi:hypothetical protein
MDLDDWLRSLGLEQYAPAFREHDMDEKSGIGSTPRICAK